MQSLFVRIFAGMERQKIPFRGINMEVPPSHEEGGFLGDALGLRPAQGKLEFELPKESAQTGVPIDAFNDEDYLFKHPAAQDSEFIQYDVSAGTLIHRNTDPIQTLHTDSDEDFLDVTFIGKVLVYTTDKNKYFFKYLDETNLYQQVADLPEISAVCTPRGADSADELVGGQTFEDAKTEFLLKRDELDERGLYYGHALVRFAYKLYDGSIYRVSRPHYVGLGRPGGSSWDLSYLNDGTGSYPGEFSHIRGSGMFCEFSPTSDSEGADLDTWEGLIKSVVIYMSRPINPNQDIGAFSPGANYNGILPLNQEWEEQLMDSKNLLYKVDEADLTTNPFLGGVVILSQEVTFPPLSALPTLPPAPIDELSYDYELAAVNKVFNERQHMGEIITRYNELINPFFNVDGSRFNLGQWDRYIDDNTKNSDTPLAASYKVVYYLKLEDGSEKVLVYEDPTVYLYAGTPNVVMLKQFIAYPDSRAFKCVIKALDGVGQWFDFKTYDLKAHGRYNYSYAFSEKHEDAATRIATLRMSQVTNHTPGGTGSAMPPAAQHEYRRNIVAVTDVNNPWVVPVDQFYRIGNKDTVIKAINTVISEMSTSQFGEYPIYVFTSDGIYTMLQGGGTVLYAAISKANDEPAVSGETWAISGSIAFQSPRGICLINGRDVTCISDALDGAMYDDLNGAYLIEGGLATQLQKDKSFSDYIANGFIFGYDPLHNELWITNRTDEYLYAFHLPTATWWRRGFHHVWYTKWNERLLIKEGNQATTLMDAAKDDTGFTASVHGFITRPLVLSGEDYHKQIFQVKVSYAGYSFVPTRLEVFGSNDGLSWTSLGYSVASTSSQVKDITIGRLNASAKFFVIGFSVFGDPAQEDNFRKPHIKDITVQYKNKFTKRLR